jgi:hypothetical protein
VPQFCVTENLALRLSVSARSKDSLCVAPPPSALSSTHSCAAQSDQLPLKLRTDTEAKKRLPKHTVENVGGRGEREAAEGHKSDSMLRAPCHTPRDADTLTDDSANTAAASAPPTKPCPTQSLSKENVGHSHDRVTPVHVTDILPRCSLHFVNVIAVICSACGVHTSAYVSIR